MPLMLSLFFAVSVQTFAVHQPLFSLDFLLYVPVCSAPVAFSTLAMILY